MLSALWQDLRYAVRALRESPGLVLVAALSLGLGVGANVTAYSWMEGLFYHPLPGVEDEERLVRVDWRWRNGDAQALSWPDYVDLRGATRSLDGLAAFVVGQTELRTDGGAGRAWTMFVSGNYFSMLRVPPQLGRAFLLDDERTQAPVAVISHTFWQRRFQGDSSVVGRHVLVNGVDVVIVGVAPPRFAGNVVALAYDLWLPATLRPLLTGQGQLDSRRFFSFYTVGRLAPGVTLAAARAELDAAARRLQRQIGDPNAEGVEVVRYLDTGPTARLKTVVSALLAFTIVVLLVACANVASLLLARATTRRREMGVRAALGASRARVVRQLLTESLVLALVAGGVGLLVAVWARDVHQYFIPVGNRPIELAIGVNARVLLFGIGVTVGTALLFGLVPALQASRTDVVSALKDGVGGPGLGRSRTQGALVSGQIAFSLAALVAGALFMRSMANAQSVDVGFTGPERLLLVNTDLRAAGFRDSAVIPVVERLQERARALPSVTAVSFADYVPLGFDFPGMAAGLQPQGYTPRPGEEVYAGLASVGSAYFETMGVPVLRGRGFDASDSPGAPRALVVNEAFVRRFWPGQDPIGRWVTLFRDEAPRTVVGVARDGKYVELDDDAPVPFVYVPLTQSPPSEGTLLLRTTGEPRALVETLRREFAAQDVNLPFRDPRTMVEQMGAVLYVQRMGAVWLAGLGLVALFLASIGLYGLMSYTVGQRTREVGIRLAIGADRGAIVALIVRGAARLTAVGLAAGALLGVAAGFLIRSQLVGVGFFDPLGFVAAVLLLAAVALLAAWLPARRAARVDPIVALRTE